MVAHTPIDEAIRRFDGAVHAGFMQEVTFGEE